MDYVSVELVLSIEHEIYLDLGPAE